MKKHGIIYELGRNRLSTSCSCPCARTSSCSLICPSAGIVLAFKEFNYRDGILGSPWNDFKNFQFFFSPGKAWSVTTNTFLYNLMFLALYTFFSVLTAILISEMRGKRFKKSAQTLHVPAVLHFLGRRAPFLYNLFNYEYGMINTVLKSLGGNADQRLLPPRSTGTSSFPSFVHLEVGRVRQRPLPRRNLGMDQECHRGGDHRRGERVPEHPPHHPPAAPAHHGDPRPARRRPHPARRVRHVLPAHREQRDPHRDATDIIDTLVFRSLVGMQDFGMATAAGFYQSVLCFVIIMIVNRRHKAV